MENENFDEELKGRIKQVFEGYEDGTANEGWNRFREKFPEKKHRDYLFWWFASAAALFLTAFLVWLFQFEVNKNNSPKFVKQQKIDTLSALKNKADPPALTQNLPLKNSSTKTINTKKTSIKRASGLIAQNLNKKTVKKNAADFTAIINTKKTSIKTASGLIAQNPNKKTVKKNAADSTAIINTKKASIKTASGLTDDKSFKNKEAQTVITQPKLPFKTKKEDQQPAVFTGIKKAFVDSAIQKNQKLVTASTDSSTQKQQTAIAKTPVLEVTKPALAKKPSKAEPVKKPAAKPGIFSLGLYVGTHVNFATGSNNQFGLGAGFSTDFRIGKNLSLSTGLGLMQNNLSYSGSIPTNTQMAASSYATVSSVGSTATQNTLKNTDATLLALDIPVNLTYTFLPGKNSISVSAGVSSNTFVKEVYNYNYTVAASSSSTTNSQNIPGFSNFSFAKTLNLSAGFAYPLGKNKLQIEPFLKYPLGGVGSQQLEFGSAGINLKMNFSNLKSKN